LYYLKLARFDHWIKQLFIFPGMVFALALLDIPFSTSLFARFILGFISTSFISSANYILNEWLDANSDQYHPTKKIRAAVQNQLKWQTIFLEYFLFALAGLLLAYYLSWFVFLSELLLLTMGILYNVKPFRLKEIPYIDVLSESINNAIRLLIGWFLVTKQFFPPVTILLGYWMGGAYLMAIKRFSEFRMIANAEIASLYRKSFKHYSEQSLLISAFFYALTSLFFVGVFMVKYRIELLFAIFPLCGLFCYYLHISFKNDSAAQKPEKLFREKGLILSLSLFILIVCILMFTKIPFLESLLETSLIGTERSQLFSKLFYRSTMLSSLILTAPSIIYILYDFYSSSQWAFSLFCTLHEYENF